MIRADLYAVLKRKKKTLYWLSRQTGIRHATLHALANAKELRKVDMRNIEKVARALGCGIGDVLKMGDGEQD